MAKIKIRPKIFNDFDPSIYDICENWDAINWLEALTERASTYNFFLRDLPKGRKAVLLPEHYPVGGIDYYLSVAEKRLENPINTSCVSRISAPVVIDDFYLRDIVFAWEVACEAELLEMRSIHDCRLVDIGKYLGRKSDPFLSVNLDYPDEIIKERFSCWLQSTRERLKSTSCIPSQLITKKDMKDWCDKRLLPYLDLKFWSVVSGENLSFAEIRDKVFSDIDATEDDLPDMSKSLQTKALKLISRDTLLALAQVAQLKAI